MKTRIFLLALFATIAFSVSAQSNYYEYIAKAWEKINSGECDAAERNYNVYLDLTGNSNVSLEDAIAKCQESSKVKNTRTDYVDLGLPSGTLWRNKNEDNGFFYTWNQAVQKFGNKLPTLEQLEELKTSCTWLKEGRDFKVIGPNGKFIIFQATGYRLNGKIAAIDCGYYWSLTSTNKGAWNMICLSTGGAIIIDGNRELANPVRLVDF